MNARGSQPSRPCAGRPWSASRFLILTPRFAELDTVLELTVYMIMAILALSLALVWGYGGILCFGQSAFFGLGAYTYAIAMFNIGESTMPLLLAIVAAGGVRRAARLFHVLWPHQRRLSRRHHADGDADPVQFGQFHRRSGIPHRRRRGSAASTASRESRRSTCPATRPRRSISKACSICRPRRCWRPISGCACCWRAGSAASSSASGRTNAAPNCSATIRGPTSSRPSPSAARWPVLPAACSPIGATSSARPFSAWRNRRRSSSGSLSAAAAR